MNPKLTSDRLARRAVVYVRQSSPDHVLHHQESQRLVYGLVKRARQLGFADVRVIHDELGRSGDGKIARPMARSLDTPYVRRALLAWLIP